MKHAIVRNYNIPIFNFSGHLGEINAVCVTRSNQIIFAIEDRTIRIWDIAQKKLVQVFHSVNNETKFLSLSSNEKYLLAADPEGFLEIWDLSTMSRFCRVEAFTVSLTTAFFSNREDVIISSGYSDVYLIQKHKIDKNGNLKAEVEFDIEEEIKFMGLGENNLIFALGSEEIIQLTFKGLKIKKEFEHDNLVSLYFSDNAKYVIGINTLGLLKIWQIKNFKLLYERQLSLEEFPAGVTNIKFLEDSFLMIYGDSTKIKIWDLKNDILKIEITAEKRKGKIDYINCIEISPSQDYLVLGCNDRLRIVDLQSGKNILSIRRKPMSPPYHKDYQLSELSQDGQFLICIRKLVDKSISKELIEVWDLTSIKKIHEIIPEMGPENKITALRISSDSKFFVTGDNAKETGGFIWNLKTGKRRKKLKELDYGVNSVFITQDNSMIITSDETFDIEVFESKTGKFIRRLSSTTKHVASFAMTRDNQKLVCAYRDIMDRDSDIIVWNFESGNIEQLLTANIDSDDQVIWVGFSSDEKLLLAKSRFGYLITYETKNWNLRSSVLTLNQEMRPHAEGQIHSYPLAENIILNITKNVDITPKIKEFLENWSKKNLWLSLSEDSYSLKSEVGDQELNEYETQIEQIYKV